MISRFQMYHLAQFSNNTCLTSEPALLLRGGRSGHSLVGIKDMIRRFSAPKSLDETTTNCLCPGLRYCRQVYLATFSNKLLTANT